MSALIHDKDIRKTAAVYIEWTDSMSINGWQYGKDLTAEYVKPATIVSIGFIIQETVDFITISTSISNSSNVMSPLTITKHAITKRKKLKL